MSGNVVDELGTLGEGFSLDDDDLVPVDGIGASSSLSIGSGKLDAGAGAGAGLGPRASSKASRALAATGATGSFLRNLIPTLGSTAASPSLGPFSEALDAALAETPAIAFSPLQGMRTAYSPLVDVFLHPTTSDLLLLSARNLEAFSLLPPRPIKLLDAVLLTNPPGSAAGTSSSTPAALHAGYISNLDELAVIHADNTLRFYSTRPGTMASLLRSTTLEMDPIALVMMPSVPSLLVVGAIAIAKLPHVQTEENAAVILHTSEKPISSVLVTDTRDSLLVTTTDPVETQQVSLNGKPPSLSFATHPNPPVLAVTALSSTVLLTASPTDSTLAVYHLLGSRNLVRFLLPFPPSCLAPTDDPFLFLVGGEDGSVVMVGIDVERVVPVSLSLKIVATVSRPARRVPGKILRLFLLKDEIIAVGYNGSVNRWSVHHRQAFPEVDDVDRDMANRTRIAARWAWLVEAQRALANILSGSTGLHEVEKDGLVEAFQNAQQRAQEAVKELDDRLERLLTEVQAKRAVLGLRDAIPPVRECSWKSIDINASYDDLEISPENKHSLSDAQILIRAAGVLCSQRQAMAIMKKADGLKMVESALRSRLQGILLETVDQRMAALQPDDAHYEETRLLVEEAKKEICSI